MVIRVSGFTGEIPRIIPRLLPNGAAQATENAKFENGAIMPLRRGRFAHRLAATGQRSIYFNGADWLSRTVPVNIAPAPVATDRLYITGDGEPELWVAGTTYPLAVPRPDTAPAAALVSGSPDPDLQQTLLYVYTWVTAYDEESEPSPVSNTVLWSSGLTVRLSGIAAAPAGRAIDRIRFYRSQTSALGETSLYFIAERAVSAADFDDAVDTNPIGEPLPSLYYNAPPADLAGIIALPNGMMAGFSGKKVYFCEPYRPHAWPEKYALTVNYPIVGLGAFGSSLAVLTEGQPYIISGQTPESMSMDKLEVNLPCLSSSGIVDLGPYLAYPSPDGLVIISSNGAQLIGAALMSRDDWQRLNPASFLAGSFAGRYIASYSFFDADSVEHRGMIVIDPSGQQPFITRGADSADAMFLDPRSGSLYLLKNGQDIYEWDALTETAGEYFWRSKQFVLPGEANFGAILIEGEGGIAARRVSEAQERAAAIRAANLAMIAAGEQDGSMGVAPIGIVTFAGSLLQDAEDSPFFMATVYADGVAIATVTVMNEPARLPSGFLAKTWEIELRGNQMVTAVSLALSPSELAQ